MRRIRTFCLSGILLCCITTSAQIKLLPTSSLQGGLQKIVAQFPLQFASIRGEVVDHNPQSTEYRSTVSLNGADHCSIVSYSSEAKPVYSWQAIMYAGEDFEAAAKKYKWLYHQVKGANVYYVNDQYTLRGNYQEADESRGFAVSTLAPVRPPEAYKKLKVDVSIQFEFPEWKVQLLVYEKEREDEEEQ